MLKTILPFVLFAVLVSGCSGTKPEVKTSTDAPKITEDDISDDKRLQRSLAPETEDKTQAQQQVSPQAGPLPEETPRAVEPGQKQRRRFIFDRNSGKGREGGSD